MDGASALVHIVRTQLVKEPYKDSLSFQISEFNHPKDDSGPDSAKEALLDRENQRLFVLEELDSFSRELNTPTPNLPGLTTDNEPGDVQKSKTSGLKEKTKIWSFKDLVSQMWSVLEHIRDRHVAELASPTLLELKMPLQNVLEGFESMDIVRARPLMNPREIRFKSNGKAWWKFAREIKEVTLFGKDFGEILMPGRGIQNLCRVCREVPRDQEYLTVSMSLLKEIREHCSREGDVDRESSEIAKGFSWSASDEAFKVCQQVCRRDQVNRVQKLQSKQIFSSKGKNTRGGDAFPEVDGALIFGDDSIEQETGGLVEQRQDGGGDSTLGTSVYTSSPPHFSNHVPPPEHGDADSAETSLGPLSTQENHQGEAQQSSGYDLTDTEHCPEAGIRSSPEAGSSNPQNRRETSSVRNNPITSNATSQGPSGEQASRIRRRYSPITESKGWKKARAATSNLWRRIVDKKVREEERGS